MPEKERNTKKDRKTGEKTDNEKGESQTQQQKKS